MVNPAFARVVPLPLIVPPVQLSEPSTVSVPVPVSVPLLNVKLVTDAAR